MPSAGCVRTPDASPRRDDDHDRQVTTRTRVVSRVREGAGALRAPLRRQWWSQSADAARVGHRDPGLWHDAVVADRLEPRGARPVLSGAQPYPLGQPDPLQPLQEAPLADAWADFLPAPPAAGQARRRAARDH